MNFDWSLFLNQHHQAVVEEWVTRLHNEGGENYCRRPLEELKGTVECAFQANFQVLVHRNYELINAFHDEITKLRLAAGFSLCDVQQAFEFFREVIIPFLFRSAGPENIYRALNDVNQCLSYTIYRFSDHFQKMHERHLVEYARELESEVEVRTAELRESELNYKTLVEEIHDGYLVIQNRVIVFANEAFCTMHECTRNLVIGQPFFHFIAPESRAQIDWITPRRASSDSADQVVEYLRLTAEGQKFPTEIRFQTTRFRHRISHIGVCRDITQRVEMERKIREADRMVTIGQITASLSHEIRNPLSAVNLNLQIIQKNRSLKGNDQRRIDISVREVKRLESILQELLDFAKPLSLNLRLSPLNPAVYRCIELLEEKFKEKKIRVDMELDPTLPDFFMDSEKVQQAIMNLILNAIDASPFQGSIRLVTSWDSEDPEPEATVVVQDEGEGLSPEASDQLFKPFFTTKSKGTGLGLTNVERVAQAHGGTVSIDSTRSKGAGFIFTLPMGDIHGPPFGH